MNLCAAYSRLAKLYSEHFKCPSIFNLIFNTKLNTVSSINFFELKKIEEHTKTRLTDRLIYQKQTDNPKWLILSKYITDMCHNITEKKKTKNAKIEHTVTHRNILLF